MAIPTSRLLCILLACLPLAAGAQVRSWTDSSGRTFQAIFVRLNGDEAIFQYEGGRSFSTPLANLSPQDQATLLNKPEQIQPLLDTVAPQNFGRPWPRGTRTEGSVQAKVISENKETGRYVYESPYYRFHCDARLTQDVLANFAMMFETTRSLATNLPLSLYAPKLRNGKQTIFLFESMQGYYQAGGMPGSAGCFMPSAGAVLVPMESLGLTRTGTGFSLDTTRKNSVIIHELAHQLTPFCYMSPGARGWFSEGLAEYFAATPYTWGYFQPDIYGNSVLKYVTARGDDGRFGRNLGNKIAVPKLKNFFLMPYGEFSGPAANRNYGVALLLTHYFFHMEGGGKATRITEFLKAQRKGIYGEPGLAPLLGGGSYEKLETEIADAWRKKGIELVFGG